MTLKTFISAFSLVAILLAPLSGAQALEIEASSETTSTTEIVISSEIPSDTEAPVMTPAEELAVLKIQEKDPETGTFMRFLLRIKIRQIENQLNIKKALK